ncbi:MAG: hypothetical protein U1C74_09315 [Phenylobacterium sp.]|nr:hypothetical protein [Phenylobacterium sp.]
MATLPVRAMPIEWFFSPSMWSLFGADFLSGLRRNRSSKKVFDVLRPLSASELRRLHGLALLNHRRHEAVSRGFAIAFLTLPASAALTLSELSPATLQRIASVEGPGRWYLMLGYAAAVVALYMMFAWRARQLLTLIEMWLIQTGLDVRDGAMEEDAPISPPMG